MRDPKTTAAALATAITTLMAHWSVIIPESLTVVLLAVGMAITGYFSADSRRVS